MTNDTLTTANQYYREGQFDKALTLYQELAIAEPNDPEIWHAIASLNAQRRDFSNAKLAIQKALALSHKDPSLHNTAGNIAMQLQDFSEAAEQYKKAIRLNPHYNSAQNNLGNAYYQQKKFQSAERAYQKVLAMNPAHRDALFNLAVLYKRTQRTQEAIHLLKDNMDSAKTHPLALGQLGQWLLEETQYEEAKEILTEQARLFPNDSDALTDLGHALLELNEIEQAILWLEKAVSLDGSHPQVNHTLATAYLKSNQLQQAMTYYLQQLQVLPQIETYYNLGVLLMYQERQREAIHYFEQALTLDNKHLATHLNLGSVYLRLNEHGTALRHYRHANEISPNNPEIQYVMSALDEKMQPNRAPTLYIEHLFDEYAAHYDRHLTGKLKYQLPDQLATLCAQELGEPSGQHAVLDLGCGSGLSGKAFKPFAKKLVGVDVSQNMLEEAKNKQCYDTLLRHDIETVTFSESCFDLIVAADVLSYFGDLNPLFSKVKMWLSAHGYFLFSVERGTDTDYQLQKTMRYLHHRNYIESLAETHGFEIQSIDNGILRQQNNKDVEGYLVLARQIPLN